jgi:hypothetical protein
MVAAESGFVLREVRRALDRPTREFLARLRAQLVRRFAVRIADAKYKLHAPHPSGGTMQLIHLARPHCPWFPRAAVPSRPIPPSSCIDGRRTHGRFHRCGVRRLRVGSMRSRRSRGSSCCGLVAFTVALACSEPDRPMLVPSASADASPTVGFDASPAQFEVPSSQAPPLRSFCAFRMQFLLEPRVADAGVDGSANATCRAPLPSVPLDAGSIPPPEAFEVSIRAPDSNDIEHLLYVEDGQANCGWGGWYAEDSSWPSELLLCPMTCDALALIGSVQAEARDNRCVEPRP